MTNVNDNTSPAPTTNEHTDGPTDFSLHPTQQLSCLIRTCVGYKDPKRNQLLFWGERGTPAALRCAHCQTNWQDAGELLRQREGWNTPYKGFAIAALSGIVVWFLPKALLPWPNTWKIGISIACAIASLSAILQLVQQTKRWRSQQLFSFLGEPANLTVPNEVAKQLQERLEGKSSSLDGSLKQQLLVLARHLQHDIMPAIVGAQHATHILTLTSMDDLHKQAKQGSFSPKEQSWIEQRLQMMQHFDDHKDQWKQDIQLAFSLLDTMVHELDDLKSGNQSDKEEAREQLEMAIKDGDELLQRVRESGA
jgi:hypothetical protein